MIHNLQTYFFTVPVPFGNSKNDENLNLRTLPTVLYRHFVLHVSMFAQNFFSSRILGHGDRQNLMEA